MKGYSFDALANKVTDIDDNAVHITGDESVGGVKTFTSNPRSSGTQDTAGGALTRKDYVDGEVAKKANTSHTHTTEQVTGLDDALAGKAPTVHTHTKSQITDFAHGHVWDDISEKPDSYVPSTHTHTTAQVTGLDDALGGKAPTVHTHTKAQITDFAHGHGWDEISGKPTSFAPSAHTHAIAQVTDLDDALAGKAPTTHSHSTAQVTGLDTALAGKAPTTHNHSTAQVTGLDAALAAKATPADIDTKVAAHAGVKASATVFGHSQMSLSGTTLTITF